MIGAGQESPSMSSGFFLVEQTLSLPNSSILKDVGSAYPSVCDSPVTKAVTRVISDKAFRQDTNHQCALVMTNMAVAQQSKRRIPLLVNIQDGIDKNEKVWFYTSNKRKQYNKDGREWTGDILVVAHRDPSAAQGPHQNGIKFDSSNEPIKGFENVAICYGANKSLGIKARKYQLLSNYPKAATDNGLGFNGLQGLLPIGDDASFHAVCGVIRSMQTNHASGGIQNGDGGGGGAADANLSELFCNDHSAIDLEASASSSASSVGTEKFDSFPFYEDHRVGTFPPLPDDDEQLRGHIQALLAKQPNEHIRQQKINVIQDACRGFLPTHDDGGGGACDEDGMDHSDLTEASSDDDIRRELLKLYDKAPCSRKDMTRFELLVVELEKRGSDKLVHGVDISGKDDSADSGVEVSDLVAPSLIASTHSGSMRFLGHSSQAEIDAIEVQLKAFPAHPLRSMPSQTTLASGILYVAGGLL